MISRTAGRLLVGVGLILAAWLSIAHAMRTPSVAAATAPETEFSAERAMRHVRVIAESPHASGTPGHARVRQYVVDELRALGLEPVIQEATAVSTKSAVAGRIWNVLVRLPGTERGKAVLLASHYDGVPAGPAAADAASATAAIIETLRALRAGPALRNDVVALITDGEEAGLLGAAAFVREHPWAKDVGVILNFEARGVRGPSLMFETGAGNLDVVRVLRRVAGARATSISTAVYRRLPNDTDLSEFAALGLPAMNFAFIGGVNRYHTSEDDAEHLSQGSLQHHGVQALALAREFGDEPLPRPATPDGVYFFFPLVGLVLYPVSAALPLSLVAVVLIGLAFVKQRAARARAVASAAAGAGMAAFGVVLAAALGFVVANRLGALHVWLASGTSRWSAWYGASVAILAVACVMLASAVARRAGEQWHLGALAVFAACAVALSATIPAASYLLTWPVLAAAAAALVEAWRPADRRSLAVALAVAAVVTIELIVPTAYLMVLVALGLDAIGGALIGLLVGVAATLVAPSLAVVTGSRPYVATLVTAGAASVALLVGAGTVRTSASHPSTGTLTYALDVDSLTATLTGSASGPGRRWVADAQRSFALDTSPATRTGVLVRVPARLPAAIPPGPVIREVRGARASGSRVVDLRVIPGPGAAAVGLSLRRGQVLAVEVDGRAMDRSRASGPESWSLLFIAPPDTGFQLTLTLGDSAAELAVTSRLPGLPLVPGAAVPSRPIGVLPIQSGDVTVVRATRTVGRR